ncbi:hypothetical protein PSP6_130219 [Paraburkholderia tropica]|nr:hypothetical protein PSP6_130219 [Paraburkholderia tropica]
MAWRAASATNASITRLRWRWPNSRCCPPCARHSRQATRSWSPTARVAVIRSPMARRRTRCTSRRCWNARCIPPRRNRSRNTQSLQAVATRSQFTQSYTQSHHATAVSPRAASPRPRHD